MNYSVKLLSGINDIKFGMPAEKVRSMMNGKFISKDALQGISNLEGKFFIDEYEEEGVVCHYDSIWNIEAMSFHRPAVLLLGDIDLLGLTVSQALSLLEEFDKNIIETEDDFTSKKYSITFRQRDSDGYARGYIQNFLVAGPNYFDFVEE